MFLNYLLLLCLFGYCLGACSVSTDGSVTMKNVNILAKVPTDSNVKYVAVFSTYPFIYSKRIVKPDLVTSYYTMDYSVSSSANYFELALTRINNPNADGFTRCWFSYEHINISDVELVLRSYSVADEYLYLDYTGCSCGSSNTLVLEVDDC